MRAHNLIFPVTYVNITVGSVTLQNIDFNYHVEIMRIFIYNNIKRLFSFTINNLSFWFLHNDFIGLCQGLVVENFV